jgi:CBS domain-containing protein
MLLIHPPSILSCVVVEIPSTASVADAVMTLSRHNILSAPVRNVDAPEGASWIDRYLGEFTQTHRHYFGRAAGSPAT